MKLLFISFAILSIIFLIADLLWLSFSIKNFYLPNLQKITFISEKLGLKIQLKVAASTIRTVEKKGGLDDFLVSTPNSKLPEKAKKLKKTILSKIN